MLDSYIFTEDVGFLYITGVLDCYILLGCWTLIYYWGVGLLYITGVLYRFLYITGVLDRLFYITRSVGLSYITGV